MLSGERFESLLKSPKHHAKQFQEKVLNAYNYAIQLYTDAIESETFATYGQLILPLAVLVSVVLTILLCSVIWKILYYTSFLQGFIFESVLIVLKYITLTYLNACLDLIFL